MELMNKNILLGVLAAGTLAAFSLVKPVSANEGTAMLRGATGTSGACYVASVFHDGQYKVLATCRDLKIALSPEKNKYVLWIANEKDETLKLGEIVSGKFYGAIDRKFVRLFVTVESSAYNNKPSEDVILTGNLTSIDFGAGVAPEQMIATPTPTPSKVVKETVTKAQDVTTGQTSSLGSAVGTVFKIVLLGFGVLLLIVGVFSFLSRRRSL